MVVWAGNAIAPEDAITMVQEENDLPAADSPLHAGLRSKASIVLAALLAIAALAALVFGVFCLSVSRYIVRMSRDELIELTADLSEPGVYGGRFKHVRRYEHGFKVYLRMREPLESSGKSEGLRGFAGRWLAVDKTGNIILNRPFNFSHTPKPEETKTGDLVYPIMTLGEPMGDPMGDEYPTGTWPFTLTVDSGAAELRGVQYRITARHPVCFLTWGVVRPAAWCGAISLVLSIPLTFGAFGLARRVRRRLRP
ncbi:MAG: hypothetical protein ACYTAN_15345 [Planctomycetota bacterium]|jgi:hypothetical protein